MKHIKCIVSGILAGLFIGIGAFAYVLAKDINLILASFLFSIGLLLVCFLNVNLFTGKIGWVFDNKADYALNLVLMLIGNIIGAVGMGYMLFAIFNGTASVNTAINIANSRAIGSGEPFYKALIMSFLCGMMVYFAVYFYKFATGGLKIFGLVFSVAIFVVTGMEHCIANMFYYSLANAWSWPIILNVLICIVGNSLGAICLNSVLKFISPDKK